MALWDYLIPKSVKDKLYQQAVSEVNKSNEQLQSFIDLRESVAELNRFQKRIKEIRDTHDSQSIMALLRAYRRIVGTKQHVIQAVDSIREFYMTNIIIGLLTEDSLAPDISTNEILRISSKENEVNVEIQNFLMNFNLDRLVEDIVPEMIAYGDYTLKLEVEKDKGVVDIVDCVDQSLVIPFINRGELLGFVYLDYDNGDKIHIAPPYEYLSFSLLQNRTRVDIYNMQNTGFFSPAQNPGGCSTSNSNGFEYGGLFGEFPGFQDRRVIEDKLVLPRYIRIGTSVIYPIISKLKELELLEALVPANKLSQMSQASLLGLQVPPNYDIDKAFEAARKFEGIVNQKIGYSGETSMLTADAIINAAGEYKVIPQFGEKGNIGKIDYRSTTGDDLLSSVEDIRRTICTSMGFVYEMLFAGDGGSKQDLLKRYARYLRKVRGVQHSVIFTIKQLLKVHLTNKNIYYNPDDIDVSFITKIPMISEIENLELQDSCIGVLGNMCDAIQSLTGLPGSDKTVNLKNFFRYVDRKFRSLDMPGVVIPDNAPSNSGEPNELDLGGGSDMGGGDFTGGDDFGGGDFGGEDMDFGDTDEFENTEVEVETDTGEETL